MRSNTTYTEKNGLGTTTRHTLHARPSAAHIRAVNEWFAVWHRLTPRQQAAWRALTKEQREATKQLTAEQFAEVMQ